MYCENCGKLIEEGNKFCPYCGTKLVGTEEKVEEEISHEIRTDEIPEQEIPKRSTMQDNMVAQECAYTGMYPAYQYPGHIEKERRIWKKNR